MRTYTTVQGDTWDLMAYNLYGSEKHMSILIRANWPLADILVFPSGVILNVPDRTPDMPSNLPFWITDRPVTTVDGRIVWRE